MTQPLFRSLHCRLQWCSDRGLSRGSAVLGVDKRVPLRCGRKGSKAHKAAAEERRQAATLLFMKCLPGLLRKYQTDPLQVRT